MPLSPDLAHLFSTNTAPISVEAQHIQNEINTLAETIDRLQAQLQTYRALLSPVRRIPPEILGEIFIFTTE
jgi:hypothetical protein